MRKGVRKETGAREEGVAGVESNERWLKREDGARGAARHENLGGEVGVYGGEIRSEGGTMPGGYFAFAASRRPEVSAKNPGKSAPELAKIMGAEWRKLSEGEKAKWTAQAKAGGSKSESKGGCATKGKKCK